MYTVYYLSDFLQGNNMQNINQLNNLQTSDEKNIKSAQMNADLGLFNQLLEMVDGDWSDSIKGVCNHIRSRFNFLGVVQLVYDKSYNELIYIEYSFEDNFWDKISQITEISNKESIHRIIKKIYSGNTDILEYGFYDREKLTTFSEIYFDGDRDAAVHSLDFTGLQSLLSIPIIEHDRNYKCFIQVFLDSKCGPNNLALLDEYTVQLNVALEIIFLVRELYIKATHDGLTKLFNRKQGNLLLNKEIDRVRRNNQPLSVAMLDIDFFKNINDKYGHLAGDMVLQKIGCLITDSLRKCDIVSRYGGEEFLVVLPDTDLSSAIWVLKRLKDQIQNYEFNFDNFKFNVTASFGVAQHDKKRHLMVEQFIEDADKKLYLAKGNGRNRVEF